jgi:hypothetical protein
MHSDPQRRGRIARRIRIVGAKLAAVAAIGYALYTAAHLNEHRSGSGWTATSQGVSATKVASRGSASSAAEQQRAGREASCATQTWPNIAAECITGRAQPPGRETAPAATALSPITPDRGAARSELMEPAHTGSLAAVANEARVDNAEAAPARREARRRVKSRARQHASRPARSRWTARAQRPVYGHGYSRKMYASWWSPFQAWRDERSH